MSKQNPKGERPCVARWSEFHLGKQNPRQTQIFISVEKVSAKGLFYKCGSAIIQSMTNYCIFRIEKIKSDNSVANLLKEQLRIGKCPHADSSKSDENYYYELSLDKPRRKNTQVYDFAIAKYKDKLTSLKKKPRKDSVRGLSFFVGFSESLDFKQNMYYFDKALTFIKSRFGEILSFAVHMDEKTPHLQVITMPIVDGSLNAKKLIGGSKYKMSAIQTDFYTEVGHHYGFSRGIEKEKTQAVHQTVEEFHRQKEQDLRLKEKSVDKKEKQLKLKESIYKKRFTESENLHAQRKEFDKEIKEFDKELEEFEKAKKRVENQDKQNESYAQLLEKKSAYLDEKDKELSERYSEISEKEDSVREREIAIFDKQEELELEAKRLKEEKEKLDRREEEIKRIRKEMGLDKPKFTPIRVVSRTR